MKIFKNTLNPISYIQEYKTYMELALRSGCVMDCHATTRGSIPVGDGVKTELHVLCKGHLLGVPSLK